MFVLRELEKILHDLSILKRPNNQTTITLPDIDRIDVDALLSRAKIRLDSLDMDEVLKGKQKGPNWLQTDVSEHQSTNSLFVASIKSLLLDPLSQTPTSAYPSARLIICDRKSLRHLIKLQRIASSKSSRTNSSGFFLNRHPYNVTAVLLIGDIVEIIDRLDRPLVILKRGVDSAQVAQFDYTIIKQVFPYLRISDLIVVLNDIGSLKLKTFTIDAKREHQVIQFLTHFARSSQLIDLQAINRLLGQLHPSFDNVSFSRPHLLTAQSLGMISPSTPEMSFTRRFIANNHLTPQLTHLTLIAQNIIALVDRLGWFLESITFRAGDPTGFSKIFSQILDSTLKYELKKRESLNVSVLAVDNSRTLTPSRIPARLLVLDRYFDMQGLLRHADCYGSYLAQEAPTKRHCSGANFQFLDQTDELEALLAFEKLTDVLRVLLDLGTQVDRDDTIAQNRTFRKHLDMIKSMYKTLNTGYLLLLKFEASIESMLDTMRNQTIKFDKKDQLEFAGRLKRIGAAFKQLVGLSGSSLRLSDAIRFACILIDAISVYLFMNPDTPDNKSLVDLKSDIVFGAEFRAAFQAISIAHGNNLSEPAVGLINNDEDTTCDGDDVAPDHNDQTAGNVKRRDGNVENRLGDILDVFDAISSERCATRSLLTLEETIESFHKHRLEDAAYPSLKLSTSLGKSVHTNGMIGREARSKIVFLMLGSISHDELYRIKALERRLMNAGMQKLTTQARAEAASGSNILFLACNLIRPDEFIRSL